MKIRVSLSSSSRPLLVGAASATAQLRDGHGRVQRLRGLPLRRESLRRRAGNDFYPQRLPLDVGDDVNYGGRIGYNFTSLFELEFEYAHTDTNLEVDPFRTNLPNVNSRRPHGPVLHGLLTFNFGHGRGRAVLHDRRRRRATSSRDRRVRGSSKTYGTAAIGGGVQVLLQPRTSRCASTAASTRRASGLADVLLRLRLLLHRYELGDELRGQRRHHLRVLASGGTGDADRIRRLLAAGLASRSGPRRSAAAARRIAVARPLDADRAPRRPRPAGPAPRAPAGRPRAGRDRGGAARSRRPAPAYSWSSANVGDATSRAARAEAPRDARAQAPSSRRRGRPRDRRRRSREASRRAARRAPPSPRRLRVTAAVSAIAASDRGPRAPPVRRGHGVGRPRGRAVRRRPRRGVERLRRGAVEPGARDGGSRGESGRPRAARRSTPGEHVARPGRREQRRSRRVDDHLARPARRRACGRP